MSKAILVPRNPSPCEPAPEVQTIEIPETLEYGPLGPAIFSIMQIDSFPNKRISWEEVLESSRGTEIVIVTDETPYSDYHSQLGNENALAQTTMGQFLGKKGMIHGNVLIFER